MHVVRDHQVELAVAIVIDERTTCAPLLAGTGHAGLFGDFRKMPVAQVMKQPPFAVAGDEDIVVTIVVVVADARTLAPAGGDQASLRGDVGKGAIVIVMEEMAGGRLCRDR